MTTRTLSSTSSSLPLPVVLHALRPAGSQHPMRIPSSTGVGRSRGSSSTATRATRSLPEVRPRRAVGRGSTAVRLRRGAARRPGPSDPPGQFGGDGGRSAVRGVHDQQAVDGVEPLGEAGQAAAGARGSRRLVRCP